MTADAVRWMRERGIAVYAGDIGDAHPPIAGEVPGALHFLALGRWTFQFVVAVPRIAGTTGLPVNPLAAF